MAQRGAKAGEPDSSHHDVPAIKSRRKKELRVRQRSREPRSLGERKPGASGVLVSVRAMARSPPARGMHAEGREHEPKVRPRAGPGPPRRARRRRAESAAAGAAAPWHRRTQLETCSRDSDNTARGANNTAHRQIAPPPVTASAVTASRPAGPAQDERPARALSALRLQGRIPRGLRAEPGRAGPGRAEPARCLDPNQPAESIRPPLDVPWGPLPASAGRKGPSGPILGRQLQLGLGRVQARRRGPSRRRRTDSVLSNDPIH